MRFKTLALPFFFLFVSHIVGFGQQQLPAVLPEMVYDTSILTPEAYLGFGAGDQHVSHDQVYGYCRYLTEISNRMEMQVYAHSHEGRPLFVLVTCRPDLLTNIESIRERHIAGLTSGKRDQKQAGNQPVILYQAYSIHGDEASGTNAALWVAYYLAAGKGTAVNQLLSEAVTLLDPCQNPDGLQRFASWVNSNRNKQLTGNPLDREFHMPWPGGRTNHYWFDLNRDWLLLQHPESRGRVNLFHQWKPHVVTDHHEMGANSTFFFMPGVPSRTHPLTPAANQELTDRIADFHRQVLDARGIRYYSKERFDDFYFGKGSTYPDANGSVGILFEQAGTEGHLRQTVNGELSLWEAMRNQFLTSLSTQDAALALKEDLIRYQEAFFDGKHTAVSDNVKGYAFGMDQDPWRLALFLDLLKTHRISWKYITGSPDELEGITHFVPLDQMQGHFIRGIFETRTEFPDSLFYDVSSWTLPLAYDIDYTPVTTELLKKVRLSDGPPTATETESQEAISENAYGYMVNWQYHQVPGFLYDLLDRGVTVKACEQPVSLKTQNGIQAFPAGSLFIPTEEQHLAKTRILEILEDLLKTHQVPAIPLVSGAAISGPDLGSSTMHNLALPRVLLLTGQGVSGYEAGEVWHFLDVKLGIPVVKADLPDIGKEDLSKFNVIILPGGSFGGLRSYMPEALRDWVSNGGTLILQGSAINWATANHLASAGYTSVNTSITENGRLPYASQERNSASRRISGAILSAEADLTHPLCFGLSDDAIAIMKRGTRLMKPAPNPYASPIVFSEDNLLSGYLPRGAEKEISGKAVVLVNQIGRGKVVCFGENLLFRGTWIGTEKIYANALFLSGMISNSTAESVPLKTGRHLPDGMHD